nr:MAG TPA: hypothetical protein [Caudoviricetes sp.]
MIRRASISDSFRNFFIPILGSFPLATEILSRDFSGTGESMAT